MSVKDCIVRVEKASKGTISKIEASELLKKIKDQANVIERQKLGTTETEIRKLGQQIKDEAAIKAAYDRRRALLNKMAWDKIDTYVGTSRQAGMTSGEAFVNYMLGSPKLKTLPDGSIAPTRYGVYQQQIALKTGYYGRLEKALSQIDAIKEFRSGLLDEDVFKELWNIAKTRGTGESVTGVQQARQIAEIIFDLRQEMIGRENRAGALIKMNENYTMRQTHNPQRILKGHGGDLDKAFTEWKRTIYPLLDDDLTFSGVIDQDNFLRQVFDNIITSEHSYAKATPDKNVDAGYARPSGLAKRISSERVLHFKDAEGAWAYNQKYGSQSIRDALVTEISRHADNTVILENFGADPDGVFAAAKKFYAQTDRDFGKTIKHKTSMGDQWISPETAFETVMGYKDSPANPKAAKLARLTRSLQAWQTLSKLGGVTISAIPDKAFVHTTLTYNGLSNTDAFLANLGVFMPKTEAQKRYMAELGVGIDAFIGEINSRYSMNDLGSGGAYKLQQMMFNLNGMHWWNDIHKGTVGITLANQLANNYKTPFDQLNPDLRRNLSMYGINEVEWQSIRQAGIFKAEDGTRYLIPENIKNVTDAQATRHLKVGEVVSETSLARVRSDLELKLRTFITDQVNDAVLTPGAREKIIATWGTQAGTASGTIARLFMHFKSFPITVATKIWGRELAGYQKSMGRTTFRTLELVAMTTMGGYISMSIKDAVAGRKPRQLLDDEGNINLDVLNQALLRGGGLSIYGDLLMTEYDRAFNSPLSAMAGPTIGALTDITTVLSETGQALFDDEKSMPKAARVNRVIQSNTPFANLFYVKPVIDYMLIHRMNEFMDPGYLRDMERSIEKRNKQEFFLRPSDVIE